jgi:hypothetical protein
MGTDGLLENFIASTAEFFSSLHISAAIRAIRGKSINKCP